MAERMPTTADVQVTYAVGLYGENRSEGQREFYLWLKEHDRQVAAKTLEDAAADIRARGDVGEDGGPSIDRYLTLRAKNLHANDFGSAPSAVEHEHTPGSTETANRRGAGRAG